MIKTFITIFTLIYSSFLFGQDSLKKQNDYFDLIKLLYEYKIDISESYHLARSWVHIEKKDSTQFKTELGKFSEFGIDDHTQQILNYSYLFDSDDLSTFRNIEDNVNDLNKSLNFIMSAYNNKESYDNPFVIFEYVPMVESGGEIHELIGYINSDFDKLINKMSLEFTDDLEEHKVPLHNDKKSKIQKITYLFEILNVTDDINDVISYSKLTQDDRQLLESEMPNQLINQYDKYYSEKEIDEIIFFCLTTTGKRFIKDYDALLYRTYLEIMESSTDN